MTSSRVLPRLLDRVFSSSERGVHLISSDRALQSAVVGRKSSVGAASANRVDTSRAREAPEQDEGRICTEPIGRMSELPDRPASRRRIMRVQTDLRAGTGTLLQVRRLDRLSTRGGICGIDVNSRIQKAPQPRVLAAVIAAPLIDSGG